MQAHDLVVSARPRNPQALCVTFEGEPTTLIGLEATQSQSRRAVRGTWITLGGQAAAQLLRLAGNLVLTRLLAPQLFAPMAIVNSVLAGLHMFSDVGVGTAVIQSVRGEDPVFLRTAYSIQAMRGGYLFIAALVLGPVFRGFYPNMPELGWLIPLAGLTAVLDGLASMKLYVANRQIVLGTLTLLEFAMSASTVLVNIAIAWVWPSVFALAFGSIVGVGLRAALSHIVLPGPRDRFGWDADARKFLLSFGRWVFLSTALTFLAMHLDRFALGKLATTRSLGIYQNALVWAALPREVLGQLSARVLYPLIAERMRLGHEIADLRKKRRYLNILTGLGAGVLAGAAGLLIAVLYDSRYAEGGPLIAALSLGSLFSVLEMTYGAAALARGEPAWIAWGNCAKVLVFGSAMWLVFQNGGVLAVAWLTSISQACLWISNAMGSGKLRDLPGDFAGLAAWLLGWLATSALSEWMLHTRWVLHGG